MSSIWGLVRRAPRVLRFAAVGGFCTLLQLGILALLAEAGVWTYAANVIGFLVSTQVNALLSARVTWRERHGLVGQRWGRQLLAYNAMALGTLLVNEGVFALAHQRLHYLPAAALGSLAGAAVNYLVSNRLIFRPRRPLAAAASPAGPWLPPQEAHDETRELAGVGAIEE